MSEPLPLMYRYENHGDVVLLSHYRITKRTPKGVWINLHYGKDGFILNNATKRYACPTKEEAKTSFFARKARQLRILRTQIESVEGAVQALKEDRLNDYSRSDYYFE